MVYPGGTWVMKFKTIIFFFFQKIAKKGKNDNFKTKMFLKFPSFDGKFQKIHQLWWKMPQKWWFLWGKYKICLTEPMIKNLILDVENVYLGKLLSQVPTSYSGTHNAPGVLHLGSCIHFRGTINFQLSSTN